MDGMLSQDEINALLSGMDLSDGEAAESPAEAENVGSAGSVEAGVSESVSLTAVEKDAIGEVANISMGSSATTLYSLVNRKVKLNDAPFLVGHSGITSCISYSQSYYI